MSANLTGKRQCATCSKSGGIMTCDGCQQAFCGKHSVEHRQKLVNQLDGIMQEHDSIQQELRQSSDNNSLLKIINKWEKESITKIQVTAEAARADLKEMIDRSKERISKACHNIAVNLRSSREADDFSENDLTRWMEQLKELNLEINSPSSIKLMKDKASIIHLITIQSSEFVKKDSEPRTRHSLLKRSPALFVEERFSKVIGMASIHESGLLARCSSSTWDCACILGEQLYSQGQQMVRFKIEQSAEPYNIFFGCISSKVNKNEIKFTSPFAVGWFGVNRVYQHGSSGNGLSLYGYTSKDISTNDVLHLTFDCENRQLKLFHERLNKTYTLPVNVDKAPFPWQLLLVLTRIYDCVRILL